jgi:cbb3-type cytochrome oxidase maturation protein
LLPLPPPTLYTRLMSAVYIALPVALLLAIAGVAAFIWATRSGQMDDLETPGQRVLFDDDDVSARGDGDTDSRAEN